MCIRIRNSGMYPQCPMTIPHPKTDFEKDCVRAMPDEHSTPRPTHGIPSVVLGSSSVAMVDAMVDEPTPSVGHTLANKCYTHQKNVAGVFRSSLLKIRGFWFSCGNGCEQTQVFPRRNKKKDAHLISALKNPTSSWWTRFNLTPDVGYRTAGS